MKQTASSLCRFLNLILENIFQYLITQNLKWISWIIYFTFILKVEGLNIFKTIVTWQAQEITVHPSSSQRQLVNYVYILEVRCIINISECDF
jgi:hypothetical protein